MVLSLTHRMHRIRFPRGILLLFFLPLVLRLAMAAAPDLDFEGEFDDRALEEPLSLPHWFKLSFLDLDEDLREAEKEGKIGLMVYFGQKRCPYCYALLENNFGKTDIRDYTRTYFDVVGIDIHGSRQVIDLQGKEWTESSFSDHMDTNFTPTLIFYNLEGEEALRLPGYYPPYKFRAALEYVADDHYRKESFRSYLARADVPLTFDAQELNYEEFFLSPPYALDRSRWPADKPLLVFFEQPDCHACDILHTGPLQQRAIRQLLKHFDLVQLNMWGDTPVITPQGLRTTSAQWAEELGLFYSPTLIFYDQRGKEIIRVDSVVQLYRLLNVLEYTVSGDYKTYPNFQQWRSRHQPDHSQ